MDRSATEPSARAGPRARRRASRLLRLWLQFQVPTVLLVLLAISISPSGGTGWPIGLGVPAAVILTVCALVAWFLEGRAPAPGRVLGPANPGSPGRLAWAYLILPWLLAQGILIPLSIFAAEFTLGGSPGGVSGGLAAYGLGTAIYALLVGLPLAVMWWRRRPRPRRTGG